MHFYSINCLCLRDLKIIGMEAIRIMPGNIIHFRTNCTSLKQWTPDGSVKRQIYYVFLFSNSRKLNNCKKVGVVLPNELLT